MGLTLHYSVKIAGREVSSGHVDPMESFEVGPRGDVELPAPEGRGFLVNVQWLTATQVVVIEPDGTRNPLRVDQRFDFKMGQVEIELSLLKLIRPPRAATFITAGSLAWFAVVLAQSLMVAQVGVISENRCTWAQEIGVGEALLNTLGCLPPQREGRANTPRAEYLVRLLRKDFEGAEEGGAQKGEERPERKVITRQESEAYIPAGQNTDRSTMRGGDTLGDKVERAPEPKKQKKKKAKKPKKKEVTAPVKELAKPEPKPPEPEEVKADEAEDAVTTPEGNEESKELGPAPTEDEIGFGLADWLDASPDADPETLEVKLNIAFAKERLRIDPNDVFALGMLAYYEYLDEDYEASAGTYDRLLELQPEVASHYNNKALIYKRWKKYEEEEGMYRVALALNPSDTVVMNNLAVNLSHQGRFEEAWALMERVEQLDPGEPYAELHRSKIKAQMGEADEALEYLEKALAKMQALGTMHSIEFRQDIRLDPSFSDLRKDSRFHSILRKYYGDDTPVKQ